MAKVLKKVYLSIYSEDISEKQALMYASKFLDEMEDGKGFVVWNNGICVTNSSDTSKHLALRIWRSEAYANVNSISLVNNGEDNQSR